MRKLLLLTTFICSLLMSSVASAEWTKLGKNSHGDTYYLDFESITKSNDIVYFWTMTDFLEPIAKVGLSMKSYFEANCKNFKMNLLEVSFYPNAMAMGKPKIIQPKTEWRSAGTGTPNRDKVEKACNRY